MPSTESILNKYVKRQDTQVSHRYFSNKTTTESILDLSQSSFVHALVLLNITWVTQQSTQVLCALVSSCVGNEEEKSIFLAGLGPGREFPLLRKGL